MSACLECGGPLYRGPRTAHADEVLCRDCQRSPVLQLRVQLERARLRGLAFEEAWRFAIDRIRWPHDTTHRRQWKGVLGVERPDGMMPGEFRRNHAAVLVTWERAYAMVPRESEVPPLEELAVA